MNNTYMLRILNAIRMGSCTNEAGRKHNGSQGRIIWRLTALLEISGCLYLGILVSFGAEDAWIATSKGIAFDKVSTSRSSAALLDAFVTKKRFSTTLLFRPLAEYAVKCSTVNVDIDTLGIRRHCGSHFIDVRGFMDRVAVRPLGTVILWNLEAKMFDRSCSAEQCRRTF